MILDPFSINWPHFLNHQPFRVFLTFNQVIVKAVIMTIHSKSESFLMIKFWIFRAGSIFFGRWGCVWNFFSFYSYFYLTTFFTESVYNFEFSFSFLSCRMGGEMSYFIFVCLWQWILNKKAFEVFKIEILSFLVCVFLPTKIKYLLSGCHQIQISANCFHGFQTFSLKDRLL